MISINEGETPIVGLSGIMPTLKDGGACLVVGLDIMLGEGDSQVGVEKWGNADQDSGEGWHNVALVGRWREVLELKLGAGGGACNGAVRDANADAGGRGVARWLTGHQKKTKGNI